jgi:hypothetical protein
MQTDTARNISDALLRVRSDNQVDSVYAIPDFKIDAMGTNVASTFQMRVGAGAVIDP